MASFSEIDDAVTVQGRLQGRKSNFRVLVQRCDSGAKKLRIRIDDDLNPGFWAEVTVDPIPFRRMSRCTPSISATPDFFHAASRRQALHESTPPRGV
jgi:hypothetical protein